MRRAAVLLTSKARSPQGRLRKPAISLEHFVQRQRALSLWREIVRATQKVTDPNTKRELRTYARDEFERNRNVTDISHIRYLISTGKTEFDGMRRYIDEQASR